jgi:formate dehydrogenase maturation protein FdhE
VTSISFNLFNVTSRCPVCGGAANARYHATDEKIGARMKRKCTDCGFTWAEVQVARFF